MSDTLSGNLLHRLRHTPLRDLMRGRVTGRLDVKGRIAACDLPAAAKDLVWRVVRRTRLWPLEKLEVADELLGHFADGISTGANVEDLIKSFGDDRSAAKLIRRAKKRNRPIPWHILRAIGWMAVAVLVLYAIMAARFVIGRPSPKVDYVAVLNKPRLAVPDEQRGWPIYRQAILAVGNRPYSKQTEDRLAAILDSRPGSKHWGELGPWLRSNAQVLDFTREAAKKPVLGFILGTSGSMNDPQLYPGTAHWFPKTPSPTDRAVVAILLPHLADLRLLAQVLAADARFAREQGDGARVLRDIEALLDLSEQLHQGSDFLVCDLVSLAIRFVALQTAQETLADEKSRLSDADLQKLAHLLSKPKLAADVLSFAGERMMIHDVIQRTYSDDGDGDGHLTWDGQRFLKLIGAVHTPGSGGTDRASPGSWEAVLREVAAAALTPALAASRQEVLAQYDGMMDVADANLRRPMREANWAAYDNQRLAARENDLELIRTPLLTLAVQLASTQNRAERYLGDRDGMVMGIALELYRRKHGQYPAALDALVPLYLPTVPADRFDGKPVRYRLKDGRPLVYSVGADRDDDGGRAPRSPTGGPPPLAADWIVSPKQAVDGDWVLYPQPKLDD